MSIVRQDPAWFREILFQQMQGYALLIHDTQGRILEWFPGAARAFGYSASEIVGRSVNELFTPEDQVAGIPEYERTAAAGNNAAEDDRWMLRKDGGRFWANGALMSLRNDTGEVVAFAKLLRDRTDVKAQIDGVRNERDALSASIARKNAYIMTLAHELRSPLSTLSLAAAQLSARLEHEDESTLLLRAIRRQIDVIARMISDLLDLARMETGKVQLELARLELGQVIHSAVDACKSLIAERRHSLKVFRNPSAVWINGDAERLQQVFVNLIENAAKFTQSGGWIYVKLTTEADEAVVKIQDNGIGISAELLPRIFELFSQAEHSVQLGGLGIGLRVVKDLVTLHGGSVQVVSEGIGKGSEFIVRLPLRRED